ncbi:MAG: hypothetical protein CMM76_02685 [Rhodospirillaceae bacterium]|nr:hypothetical protein [Rhodospirillaceae bacterium]
MLRKGGYSATDNAMTEIALALAMGFFAIMVLAIVSMGAGATTPNGAEEIPNKKRIMTSALASASSPDAMGTTTVSSKDRLVIFYDGRFYDDTLKKILPENLGRGGRVILAVPPTLSMSESLGARAEVSTRDLIVTTLDRAWMKRLKDLR